MSLGSLTLWRVFFPSKLALSITLHSQRTFCSPQFSYEDTTWAHGQTKWELQLCRRNNAFLPSVWSDRAFILSLHRSSISSDLCCWRAELQYINQPESIVGLVAALRAGLHSVGFRNPILNILIVSFLVGSWRLNKERSQYKRLPRTECTFSSVKCCLGTGGSVGFGFVSCWCFLHVALWALISVLP